MLTQPIQAIRGMNDVLPSQVWYWQYLERQLRHLANSYGYSEIRFPIVEQTSLFKRSIGEATDIVEKEMYTFEDRNGDSLTLRPEGTAGCVRASIQNGLLYNQMQRFWYMGPMFRHERPQKGRYRQFHQFGVEAFGIPGPDIDVEMILMSARLWRSLGIDDYVSLQINSLGSISAREQYRKELVAYFSRQVAELDEDSQRRLITNPLRILDSKNPEMQEIIAKAPVLTDFLDEKSLQYFKRICHLLDGAGVKYQINPRLVRGLDYYSDLVFEWVTDRLGAQGAVCAGGRFDLLVEWLGGKPTPAIGFAMGLERLVVLLESVITPPEMIDAYFIMVGELAEEKGLIIAEKLRNMLPSLRLLMNCNDGNFKAQFKRADKSGARIAFILGPDELAAKVIAIKFLREDRPQVTLPLEKIKDFWETLGERNASLCK